MRFHINANVPTLYEPSISITNAGRDEEEEEELELNLPRHSTTFSCRRG